jgi:hypothetical protein
LDTELFVETIGNANEEIICKYVQNQLIELDSKENNAEQLVCFKTWPLAAVFIFNRSKLDVLARHTIASSLQWVIYLLCPSYYT